MSAKPNPFIGLPTDAHEVIEKLLGDIFKAGEWDDDHEELLDQWREARGEDAKDHWLWWVGYPDDESYGEEAATREAAIAVGRARYFEEGRFQIIEARLWADNVKEGEEASAFAESRNHEVITIAGNDR